LRSRRTRGSSSSKAARDQARYSFETVDRLLEGGYFLLDGVRWMDAEPTYLDLKARVEREGELDGDWVAEMLDLERAYSHLARDYPIGAFVLACIVMGMQPQDINEVLGDKLHMGAAKIMDKSTGYIRAYMNGNDPKEAWRRGRRKTR